MNIRPNVFKAKHMSIFFFGGGLSFRTFWSYEAFFV